LNKNKDFQLEIEEQEKIDKDKECSVQREQNNAIVKQENVVNRDIIER
jgi:hypothetical protein